MLIDNLSMFSERNDKFKFKLMPFLKLQNLTRADYDKIVDILCEILMDPNSTQDVLECFPQILLLLLSTSMRPDDSISHTSHANDVHRLNSVILGKLINKHPDVIGFALRYFENNPAPFETLSANGEHPAKRYKSEKVNYSVCLVEDLEVVTACYAILRSAPQYFKEKWNWSKFYKYLRSTNNNDVRWTALKCIAIILDISESLFVKLAKTFFDDFEKFLINTNVESIRSIPLVCEIPTSELESLTGNLSCVTSIGGILLPVLDSSEQNKYNALVPVPSTEENLRRLAVAVASRKCVCLQGPVGSGKTALVEYLAKVTGHGTSDFVKVQLGDQTDSKMLLGSYRCTDIPGEFVWQPGVLTRAVTAGKWLLLEDIDSAASDVASILNNLIETGTLTVPGYRDTIYVRTDFQLFLTQRLIATSTGLCKQSSGASSLLEKNWQQINVEPLSKSELVTIIQTFFPALNTVATRMVDVFLLFSTGLHDNESDSDQRLVMKTGRLTSTRDLMKWCNRSIIDFVVSSPESALKVFQDAIDIFCCSVPDQGTRLDLATAIGHMLGIVKTKAEFFCNIHKPTINVNSEYFSAGRAKVMCKKSVLPISDFVRSTFSFTRPSTCLLERIARCVAQKEPVLLVGETGTGKTSSIQYLAQSTGHKLIVINMNQQSESTDLLGGYKPVDIKFLITPIREEFELLFRSYFAIEPNRKFLDHVALCYNRSNWKSLVTLMKQSAMAAVKRLRRKIDNNISPDESFVTTLGSKRKQSGGVNDLNSVSQAKKNIEMADRWQMILLKLQKLEAQVKTRFTLAFAFIEGSLIKALQNGSWVLLDEINLANAETLECLSGLLEGSSGSLSLIERGDEEPIKRHPDFTLFACMNPATDVGKKELPVGLRNRFTELYVDELTEKTDLQLLVTSYLRELLLSPTRQEAIVKFYLNVRKEATNSLLDGTAHKPHYSLRTLCRALSVAASNPCGSVPRSLYEAFCLSFLTQLDHASYPIVQRMIAQAVVDSKELKAILGAPIPKPRCTADKDYINFEGYWVIAGNLEPEIPANYVLTQSVRCNLKDLVRVVSIGKMPVLLQGDTSVGKTSLITYLAKASGHQCVRINNHEHTDLQEYVGSYAADSNGKLVFKEGVLIEAMRKGHWIILDELNLAPSDVLEALNRVLDDNREIFIPETQQTVKAHQNFMLFATQNPPGLYGGRKVLSRAFRNRFVELHFNDIPAAELQTILHERCNMPDSYCRQIINVMTDLQIRRKSTAAFAGKQGFITLRDLFRWGERYRLAPDVGHKLYDWSQHLADEGYLVLAAKVRKREEAEEIRQVIKKHLKRDVDPNTLFTLNEKTSPVTRTMLEKILAEANDTFKHVVWTYHMRRLAVLVGKACEFREPVLLVGETGGGKTTICQVIATTSGKKLHAVNCHMHTESADFVGSLRPVRNHSDADNQKLFEWVDGPLIKAMLGGDLFLADEISLADDSVLERLNSLLEPERSLLLSEKGVDSSDGCQDNTIIVANESFHFIGTMNPGGDYGKKELSPALRNRFTEIWCDGCTERNDLQAIIEHNLNVRSFIQNEAIALAILDFVDWLTASDIGRRFATSIRDILTWVNFINTCCDENHISKLDVADAYLHGAFLTYVDGLGSGLTSNESPEKVKNLKNNCQHFLASQIERIFGSRSTDQPLTMIRNITVENTDTRFGIQPFFIPRGSFANLEKEAFSFTAETTGSNTLKMLRGLQLSKPILMEGSPGVGKTSLVSALSKISGHKLVRINLSEQTDVSDLFGADLPVEGGKGGEFAWRDGPFLQALRVGHWILLDELNLASQSVLEGLNACLDHRGEVYIPELGRTFFVKPGTKLFACQNPLRQGGARRGLPKSFLNRFTQVFIDALTDVDLKFIVSAQFPELPNDLTTKMVHFNAKLASEAGTAWGYRGAPWEMNLRDIVRWCEATIQSVRKDPATGDPIYNPGTTVEFVYVDRMRTKEDKSKVRDIYFELFAAETYPLPSGRPLPYITKDKFYLGDVSLDRSPSCIYDEDNLLLLRHQAKTLKSLMQCINMNWMSILIGGSGCGKTSVVHLLAKLTGNKLRSIAVNSAMDTTEILGGFEQTDYNRHLQELMDQVESLLKNTLRNVIGEGNIDVVAEHHRLLEDVRNLNNQEQQGSSTNVAETNFFLRKVEKLSELIAALKIFDQNCGSELASIETRLQRLTNLVKQDRCLNAGGKFEWVDSILVKCLQEGSWLLIDRINLCSPAVLDRLNGLLEPNGVLSIGERGADADGNLVVIKPHKNFRLFMAMDPRYGEISRAMRNRGVEIYMLGDEDNSDYSILDLQSLIYEAGLHGNSHRLALLNIHRGVAENVQIYNGQTTSIVHLLRAAFLINQQISRGFSEKRAFESVCVDVYLKSRFVNGASAKEYLTSNVGETVKLLSKNKDLGQLDVETVTWSTRNLQENSTLTVIRQQGAVLAAALRKCQAVAASTKNVDSLSLTTQFLNEALELPERDVTLDTNILEILPHLLVKFYESSSQYDAPLRCSWLSTIFGNDESFEKLAIRSEKLADTVSNFKLPSTASNTPWDLALDSDENGSEEVRSGANILSILLHIEAFDMGNSDHLSHEWKIETDKRIITVIQYSNYVHYGKLTANFTEHPLILKFVTLLGEFDKCIGLALKDNTMRMDARECVDAKLNLKWRDRFRRVGNLTLINKLNNNAKENNRNLEEVLLLLQVHYKWLIKFAHSFLVKNGERNFSNKCREQISVLLQLIESINSEALIHHDDAFRRLAKRIKKGLNLPLPCSSRVIFDTYPRLKLLSTTYSTFKDEGIAEARRDLQLMILQTSQAMNARANVISFWEKIYSNVELDVDFPNQLADLERQTNDNFVALRTPIEMEEALTKVKRDVEKGLICPPERVQLWPVFEYFFMIFANALRRRVCHGLVERHDNDLLVPLNILERFAAFPSIPIDALVILNAVTSNVEDKREEAAKMLPELFFRIAKFIDHSSTVKAPHKLLRWTGPEEDSDTKGTNQEEIANDYPIYGSGLVSLVAELIFSKSNAKERSVVRVATLGTYRARVDQLRTLNETLWRNAVALNTDEYRYRCNDAATAEAYLNYYLSATEKAEAIETKIVREKANQRVRTLENPSSNNDSRSDYLRAVRELRGVVDEFREKANCERDALEIGKIWTLMGYVQLSVFANLGYIDPVHKVGLKLGYIEEDIEDCRSIIYAAELQARLTGDYVDGENDPPRIRETFDRLNNLLAQRSVLQRCNAIRPRVSEFLALAKETADFRNSLGSRGQIDRHMNKLTDIATTFQTDPTTVDVKVAKDCIREVAMWEKSVKRFTESIERRYLPGYPDIALPLLSATSQLKYGMGILAENAKRIVGLLTIGLDEISLESMMCNLIRFPTIGSGQENLLALIDSMTNESTKEIISKHTNNAFASKQEFFRMIKCSLTELRNEMVLRNNMSRLLWEKLNYLLQQVVLLWKQQQKEQEQREIEKDSLFKNKALVKGESLSEDQEIMAELRKLFPRHRENDFSDIDNANAPTLEKRVEREEDDDTYVGLVTNEDLDDICEIHSSIVLSFTTCQWIKNDAPSSRVDYFNPLFERYNTFGLLLNGLNSSLSDTLTRKIYASLNVLVSMTAATSEGCQQNSQSDINRVSRQERQYDFYKDSNVEETKQCLPALENIRNRIRELLDEWPEHPTLKSIDMIIRRIYSFPVTSPVSRFLTGLELLLTKMQEWEENAHSGVSLSEYSLELTRQIISWRRMELSCWKDCLSIAQRRLRSDTSKWWFHLYSLVEGYLTSTHRESETNEIITKEKLIELLHLFMNTSTLAEYSPRLDLLYTYHCHVCNFSPSQKRDELAAILWNLHKYYDQFTPTVENKISILKAPIEKKLKDFVKIARWNDVSNWAVKETVEKTHRALHKFIREFETKLKQPVTYTLTPTPSKCAMTNSKIAPNDSTNSVVTINPKDFVVQGSTIAIRKSDEALVEGILVPKIGSLFAKAKKVCGLTILMSSYPGMRMSIEEYIHEIKDHAYHLKNLEIDTTQPKPKQKSQAKSILQQKKMALANHFKTLTLIGLSYRTGMLKWKNSPHDVLDLAVPPVNLCAAFLQFFESDKKIDQDTLKIWEGCDEYYYKSLVKLDALNGALITNQNDLGLQNIERCKGFTMHMTLLAHRQKRTMANSLNHYLALRSLHSDLLTIDEHSFCIPNRRELMSAAENLREVLTKLKITLEQVKLYLQACPQQRDVCAESTSDVLVLPCNDTPILIAKKGDVAWAHADAAIAGCLDRVARLETKFHSMFRNTKVVLKEDREHTGQVFIRTTACLSFLDESSKAIENIGDKLDELEQFFASGDESAAHPLVESISWMRRCVENCVKDLGKLKESDNEEQENLETISAVDRFRSDLERTINTILIAIQRQYKTSLSFNEEPVKQCDEEEDDNKTSLEEKQLTEKLIASLNTAIQGLSLEDVFLEMNNLMASIQNEEASAARTCNRLLVTCAPLLEQYLLFVQFFLNEQLATFRLTCKMLYLQLDVFLDLATNGFCVPKDLDLDEGENEGSQEGVDKGGMGLGDGEGEKDVSDRIETEDQLEDARPETAEDQKNEDKNCKEEETGIDMSEDFDSKLQDVEKNEDQDDNENDDDDENLDKEMGETEKDAEQLDKQIWGADEDENDDEQNEEEKEEESGQGEDVGEKEMSAKTDDQNDGSDPKEGDESQVDEKEKNEINEMNEPDVNDDQIDPYFGKHQPEPEPEPMELPEDMNLDGEDGKEDNPENEENPFDIDAMKDAVMPEESTEPEEKAEAESTAEDKADSSDEEGDDKDAPENIAAGVEDQDPKNDEDPEQQASDTDTKTGNETRDEEPKVDEMETEDEKTEQQEQAEPSKDVASKETDAAEQVDINKGGSRDKVVDEPATDEQTQTAEENTQQDNDDRGTGQAQSEHQEQGHSGSSAQQSVPVSKTEMEQTKPEKRKNPGITDDNRSLVSETEPEKKKLKTISEIQNKDEKADEDSGAKEDVESDMYQHIKSADRFDKEAVDAATEDQVKEQATNMEKDEETEKDEHKDVEMHQDEDVEENEEVDMQDPEKSTEAIQEKEKPSKSAEKRGAENGQAEWNHVEVDGETTDTARVPRGGETTFHTNIRDSDDNIFAINLVGHKRLEVETMLGQWSQVPATEDALAAWNCLGSLTDGAARDLTEKLRLVLEPTQASRLKGDYRTGRRINMRKVIPYIASQFRKDKIWLRRTKPSKRDYQIVLALDDSSSMADNHCKELAFESLSLISRAMNYLEVGQLCVINFGASTNVLHPLGDPFTEQSGARLMQQMRFEQKKTMIGQLVDFTVDMLANQPTSSDNAKLLVVLSDGRGIFSEGIDKVNSAVRRARLADIFLVFIIVDNPLNKDSILDIRMPVFEGGKLTSIRSYMDSFPFPFYMILREIDSLPSVLSDALRQWFEIVGRIDS